MSTEQERLEAALAEQREACAQLQLDTVDMALLMVDGTRAIVKEGMGKARMLEHLAKFGALFEEMRRAALGAVSGPNAGEGDRGSSQV